MMFRLRYFTAGESHGPALVGILEGLPAGVRIDLERVNHELWRRQQGYGRGGRMRIEQDRVEVLGGPRGGVTLGNPLVLRIENRDWVNWKGGDGPCDFPTGARKVAVPRPGHADLAGALK